MIQVFEHEHDEVTSEDPAQQREVEAASAPRIRDA